MLQYILYEQSHAAVMPALAASTAMRLFLENPLNPLSLTLCSRTFAAACEIFQQGLRQYEKPEFNIKSTVIHGEPVPVRETIVWEKPFCRLLQFERLLRYPNRDPKVIIVAPLSGHYATLLRGTVEGMLPKHDVYITDWSNARDVPLAYGSFGLDDYVDYLISIFHATGPNFHIMAVCQSSVPALAAVSLMEEANDPYVPTSMVLMGGPIDTRINPTLVNYFAKEHGTQWFRQNAITTVPLIYRGFPRRVYPGFIQLLGFMGLSLDRHIARHQDYFFQLVLGDQKAAEKHCAFYNEYRAVMDLTAEFLLQTIDTVFVHHRLAKGMMTHRDRRVRPSAIRQVALMTIEGMNDEICGVGQTEAAHGLCGNLPATLHEHYVQPQAGHYGIFSGSRFRREILPRISEFILKAQAASPTRSAARRRRGQKRITWQRQCSWHASSRGSKRDPWHLGSHRVAGHRRRPMACRGAGVE
jgi:poly(3-hydroxybutyrate) depolymerase